MNSDQITSLHDENPNSIIPSLFSTDEQGNLDLDGHRITTLDSPTGPADATTKGYVDLAISNVVVPDATSLAKGKIQLSGDLGGSADNPGVKSRGFTKIVGQIGMVADHIYTSGTNGTAEEQINTAIGEVDMAGGGTVLIRGTAHISLKPILYNYVPTNPITICGESNGGTRLLADSTLNYGIIDNYAVSTFDNPNRNLTIRDIEIDGSGLSRTSGRYYKGINSRNWYYCRVINVYCHDCTATGIGPDNLYESLIYGCIVNNNGTAATAAKSTLTSDNTNVAAGDTVTIGELYSSVTLTATSPPNDGDTVTLGNIVYTFKTILTGTAYEVLIGSNAASALDNILAAVNVAKGSGTLYGTGTVANSLVVASTNTNTTQKFVARLNGSAGNSIISTTTAAGRLSLSSATLLGGTDTVYTFVSSLSSAYDILIGTTADNSLTNLSVAINGNAGMGTLYGDGTIANDLVTASTVALHAIVISAINAGSASNTITVSEVSTHLSFSDAVLSDGQNQLIGHNGIGIASGGLSSESVIVSNCVATGNANNNFLIEADTNNTGAEAMYIFSNNISSGGSGMGFRNTGTPNVTYSNNSIYNAAKSGIYISNATAAHLATNCLIDNNSIIGCGIYGIYQGVTNNGFVMQGNTIRDCISDAIICGANNGIITSNHVVGNGRYGINLGAFGGSTTGITNVSITNNIVYNNGKLVNNTDGIFVNANSNTLSDIIITGNRCFDSQTTPTQRYGLILPTSSGGFSMTNILVANNDFTGNVTAGFYKQNTSASISVHNNIGYNPQVAYPLGGIAGSTTFSRANGDTQTATLTGNVTAAISAGLIIGDTLTLILTQDATGGHTISWPVNVALAQSSVGLILSTAANAVDTVGFVWDGSKWREDSRALSTTKLTVRDGFVIVAPDASNLVGLTVTQSDVTNNPNLATFTNSGTGHGLQLIQNGVLASNKYAAFIDSSSAQVNSPLVRFRQNSASSTQATLQLDNVGSGAALNVGTGIILPWRLTSAPTYVKGGIYFDTTLNKLRIGGATAWETITSS